jgi:hypothetical protein
MYRALAGMEEEAVHELLGVVKGSLVAGERGAVSGAPLVNRIMEAQYIEIKE